MYAYIYVCVCMHLCMNARTRGCMYVYMYACMYDQPNCSLTKFLNMFSCMCVCVYVCIHVYMYLCLYVCVHVCMQYTKQIIQNQAADAESCMHGLAPALSLEAPCACVAQQHWNPINCTVCSHVDYYEFSPNAYLPNGKIDPLLMLPLPVLFATQTQTALINSRRTPASVHHLDGFVTCSPSTHTAEKHD
jgi:hypothetical protein